MNILHIALIISLASLGVRVVTDKGMILYFLRKPFDRMQDTTENIRDKNEILRDIEGYQRVVDVRKEWNEDHDQFIGTTKREWIKSGEEVVSGYKIELREHKRKRLKSFILYLMKPVFMCSTCMASIHTLIWFPILTGELFTYKLILAMLITSIFNTVGWLFVLVLRNHSK